MKMINAGTDAINNYAPYSRNCNLGQCGRRYYAPVPSLADVQLFINLGAVKPSGIEFQYLNLCNNQIAAITTDCFILAYNGEYWYGIYKNFYSTSIFDSYIIVASVIYEDASTATFFSEQYQNATACDTLTKISVCYPYNFNSEDLNGIYVGLPASGYDVSGKPDMFYHHDYWTRQGEMIELTNKITFTANQYKNFATTLVKNFELHPELLPGWYKDYLLAVYSRGNILINGVGALVTDLNMENVDATPGGYWKAYPVISKTVKSGFGCAPYVCSEDDCVCVAPVIPGISFANAVVGVAYNKTVVIVTGSTAFTISDIVKPDWMDIIVSGRNIIFSGTPEETGSNEAVSFTITNACGNDSFEGSINVTDTPCVPVSFGSYSIPNAYVGVLYGYSIPLTGTSPFSLSGITAPDWMTVVISGSNVNLSGTPTETGDVTLSFTVTNCGESTVSLSTTLPVRNPCVEYYNNSGGDLTEIQYTACDGTFYNHQTIHDGESICIQEGSGSGGDFGYLIILGTC